MLKVEQLYIQSAIIHRLDNQQGQGLGMDLSDLTLEMDYELHNVLATHTRNGMEDGRIRYANFLGREANPVLAHCCSILDDKERMFIEGSKMLAQLLFASMSNKSISAADVAVCLANCDGVDYVCLLKLDYKENYISEARDTPLGRYIGIRKMGSGWPQLGAKLQKAAFIQRTSSDFELILLDRQKSKTDETDISLFFQKTFLNAELIDDSKTNTVCFIKGVREYVETAELPPEKKKAVFDHAIHLVVHAESIHVRQFVESQFHQGLLEEDREQHRNALLAALERSGVKRSEFTKSPEVAQVYAKKRQITLEGARLEIDPAVYEDPDKFSLTRRRDALTGEEVTDITITGLKIRKMD
jgi:nucleoid-associated protein YejK